MKIQKQLIELNKNIAWQLKERVKGALK